MSIISIGIDLAKNVFAVHGVNESGKAELCQTQSTARPAPAADRKLPPCLIGMEACSGASIGSTCINTLTFC